MDLAEKVEAIQQASYEKIKKGSYKGYPFLRLLYEAYEELYNLPCKHCASHINKYISRIKELKINQNNQVMKVVDKKTDFKLKKRARIRVFNKPHTNNNLTDEAAIAFLKVNPNRKQLFIDIPEYVKFKKDEEGKTYLHVEKEEVNPEEKPDEELNKVDSSEDNEEDVLTDEGEEDLPEAEGIEEESEGEGLNLTELREKHPDIKARSKEDFLEKLNQ